MSLRYVYRKFAAKQRICTGCGRIILRNIAVYQGELWHYGCLMEAQKKKYRCIQCGAYLSTLETSQITVGGDSARACGVCGGPVRSLSQQKETAVLWA